MEYKNHSEPNFHEDNVTQETNNKTIFGKQWNEPSITNNYHLEEVLGNGSFGEVIKATCKATNNEVAIKLVGNPFSTLYNAR
jgi:serine/threonine protein kinase